MTCGDVGLLFTGRIACGVATELDVDGNESFIIAALKDDSKSLANELLLSNKSLLIASIACEFDCCLLTIFFVSYSARLLFVFNANYTYDFYGRKKESNACVYAI